MFEIMARAPRVSVHCCQNRWTTGVIRMVSCSRAPAPPMGRAAAAPDWERSQFSPTASCESSNNGITLADVITTRTHKE